MIATMTSKGQFTLPKDVRDRMNLKPGDRLDFHVAPDGTLVGRRTSRSVMEIAGILARPSQRPVSVEEMDEGIAKAVVEEYRRSLK
ncbi:MAG: AbrB/MazE/SpoVT family DNA-binding domain-containing protein [Sphingomonadales bacterium]